MAGESAHTRYGFAVLAYACLIGGMAAQAAYSFFSGASVWNWSTLFLPLLVSPMVFGTFLSIIKSEIDLLTGSIMAFQNGFFWKQIFDGLAPIIKHSGAAG